MANLRPPTSPGAAGGSGAVGVRPPDELATKPGRRAAAEGRLVGAAGTARPAPGSGGSLDRRRRASAGRVIAVGLACFAIWLLLDANQLYQSAKAQPFGSRRTVAIIVLRPIAAVTDLVGLSGPVNAADSALGRCGSVAGTVCASGHAAGYVPPIFAPGAPGSVFGVLPYPHFNSRGRRLLPPPRPLGPPPIANPTPAHPLTLLSVGDSIGTDLGFGVADAFSSDPSVDVVQRGVIDTGLARSDYYNWPVQLEAELNQLHPKIVVIMMGANDSQAFFDNGSYIQFNTAQWWQAYAARVGLVMSEATAAGAHMIWVGLPPMDTSILPLWYLQRVNGVYKSEAAKHPGVLFFPSWKLLSNAKGGFTLYLTIDGTVQQIRTSDGVHLDPAGYDLLGQALIAPMEHAWHVDLHA